MASKPAAAAMGFPPMPMLTPDDLALLKEACSKGMVKVKVAGRINSADQAREFERHKSATVLRYLGFLEPMPDDGAYAVWRPRPGCSEALAQAFKSGSNEPT